MFRCDAELFTTKILLTSEIRARQALFLFPPKHVHVSPMTEASRFLVEEFQENLQFISNSQRTHTNTFLDTDSPDLRHSLPEPTSQQKKTEKNNVDEVSRFYTHSFLLFGGASQTS